MLEASKRLPKPELTGEAKGTEDDCKRVELTITAEMVERHARQRKPPALSLGPVEDYGAIANRWKQALLDVVVQNWAFRVNKQYVSAASAPKRPNEDVQTNAGNDKQRQHYNDNEQDGR